MRCGTAFPPAPRPKSSQLELIQAVQDRGYHGLAWAERGRTWEPVDAVCLHGAVKRAPAGLERDRLLRAPGLHPRGYKNAGVDKLEPFEVRDARAVPRSDPGKGA